MPWYDGNIPTNWKTAIERYNGAEFQLEIVFDPEGRNVLITDTNDVVEISPISIKKELDPEFGLTPTINNVSITFNDPTNYLNPDNASGIFYNYTPIGKTIVARLRNVTETTLQTITVFTGKIDRLPQLSLGFSTLICSDRRKYVLNQKLIGADSTSAEKLMTMNSAGGLVSSVTYSNTWNASPYDFELTGGALPAGLTLSSGGTIAGTPTESGTFDFTVKVTNANGEYHAIDCELYVDPNLNDDFLQALGLGDYTEVTKSTTTSLATNPSWYRVTFNGNYEWDADSDAAPHLYLDSPSGLSGNWTIYGKVKNGFNGQNANYSGLYVRLGEFDGFICGCKSTAVSGAFTAAVYRAHDSNNIHNTNISVDTIWVKIKRVSTTYYFYYRTADSGAWTALTNSTRAGTPTQVGFMVMADVTGNGYGEIDKMYYQYGDLAFTTSASLPTAAKDVAYSFYVKADGGGGEYSYEVTSGALPSGLMLTSASGLISGTPTESRTSSFTITVTDGNGGTADQDFVLSLSDEVYVYPSVLPDATLSTAYSESFTIYGSGTFDRTQVTIGDNCELGQWTIEFTSSTAFKVTGPGVSNTTGSTSAEFSITNVITIPTAAWSGNFIIGDIITFITGISYENTNAVTLLYNIYTSFGVENKYLDCSSFFGDKEIGTLNADIPQTSNLISNSGFETYSGTQDDGTADTFTDWTVDNATGKVEATATVNGGTNAVKLVYSVGPAITQIYRAITVGSEKTYRLKFYTRGDGTVGGRYAVYDNTNGAYIRSIVATNETSTSYDLVTYDFQSPAGCTEIIIYFLCSTAAGTVYFDDIELKLLPTIQVKTDVPTYIKAGETLTLTNGETTENVTITTGTTRATSYPPYITLTVSSTSNAYPGGATVTWKQRGTKDIDYSFDSFWNYCDLNKFNLSITFDRDINALEALELVGIHAGIYVMHSRGVERVAGLVQRWDETLVQVDEAEILQDSITVDSMEVFNDFASNYGYDYVNRQFTKKYRYPETDVGNASYIKHGYKREKQLDLPGYYSQTVVQALLTNLYNVFSDGLRLISFETDLKTLVSNIGERYDFDANYPDITTEIEIYGYTLNLLKKYSVVLNTVDRSHITYSESPFLEMPDGTPIEMPGGVKIRRPETW